MVDTYPVKDGNGNTIETRDYWPNKMPGGGTAGQVLAKAGPEDNNTAWVDPGGSVSALTLDTMFDIAKASPLFWYYFDDPASHTYVSSAVDTIAPQKGFGPTLSYAGARAAYVAAVGSTPGYINLTGAERYVGNSAPLHKAGRGYEIILVMDIAAGDQKAVLSECNSATSQKITYVMSGQTAGVEQTKHHYQDAQTGFFYKPSDEAIAFGTKVMLRVSVLDKALFDFVNGLQCFGALTNVQNQIFLNQIVFGANGGTSPGNNAIGKLYAAVGLSSDKYANEVEGVLAQRYGITLDVNHPYYGKMPFNYQRVGSAGLLPDKESYLLAEIGDSLSNYGVGANNHYMVGMATWLNNLSGGKIRTNSTLSKGVGGQASPTMVGRIQTDFDPLTFDIFGIQGGINNLTSYSADAVFDDLITMMAYAAGKRRVPTLFRTVTPNGGMADAEKVKVRQINEMMRRQAGRCQGRIIFIDTFKTVNDEANNDIWLPNMSLEAAASGLHPQNLGGYNWGKEGFAVVMPALGLVSSDPEVMANNLISNPMLQGSAGTVGALATGVAPDSWTLNGVNGAGYSGSGTRTGARIGVGAFDAELALTGGTATGDTMTLSQTVAYNAGGINRFGIGDTLYGGFLVQIIGNPANIFDNKVGLYLTGTGLQAQTSVESGANTTYLIPEVNGADRNMYWIITPDFVLTAGTGMSVELRHTLLGKNTSNGKVRIRKAFIKKR